MSNCSLISLMTLITPSLTHCDSYSYLLSLAQFKLLTHSLTFPRAQLCAHSLTDLCTCWIVWSFIVHPLIHLLNCLLIRTDIYLFICWIVLLFTNPPPLGDKVSMLTHIYPHKAWRKIEVIICKITRLTAHFMYGLMSDLLICTCL